MTTNRTGLVFLSTLFGAAALAVTACSDDGNLGGSSSGGNGSSSSSSSSGQASSSSGQSSSGQSSGVPARPLEEISGDIAASRTLSASKNYLLKGLVSVKAGATLTIEKGTVIMGDNASKAILLVETGAKIVAEGTADEPIVFTSQAAPGVRRAGDWGGLVILGKAPVNIPGGTGTVEGILKNGSSTTYGGTDENDDSGVLKYVRVEYAGVVLSPDNEVNGITFAGVGRGTKVDFVQVRMALDDCFEFFGGTVDAKHLICQYNQDDGFDTDNGYSGRLQFLVLQQDPSHPGEDNGFESDNDAQGSGNLPLTNPTVFNATMCGKNADPEGAQFGALIRRNARGSYNNILFSGFESTIDVRDAATAAAVGIADKGLWFKGSIFTNVKSNLVLDGIAYPETGTTAPNKDNDNGFDEVTWIKSGALSNKPMMDPGIDCFNAKGPKLGPNATISAGAITPPNDGFFDATATYVGAFKDANDNWATSGKWVVWDNQ